MNDDKKIDTEMTQKNMYTLMKLKRICLAPPLVQLYELLHT